MYKKEHSDFKLLVSEVLVESKVGKFFRWVFKKGITRLNFPTEYFLWTNQKYKAMWKELESFYI